MSEKKQKYDMQSPEARAVIDEIVHGTFMKEGKMVAFPTCFPGASTPIPADESRITALDVTPDGTIYGGTSGRAAHIFAAMFQGVTGIVFDRGVIEGMDQCVAVCCGKNSVFACLNGSAGARIVRGPLQPLPFDLIQEWGFHREPFKEVARFDGDRILHAVIDEARSSLVGITGGRLFTVDLETSAMAILGEFPTRGRLSADSQGSVFGQDGESHLWRYRLGAKRLERQAIPLPTGAWQPGIQTWAIDAQSKLLYTADAEGTLFSFDENLRLRQLPDKAPLAPVGPMAVTHDGRLFGFCGDELSKMFCYNPRTRRVSNLGVAVSVLERRRYGYTFGAAATGRDGEILFGEDDDLGHLWLYFPSIQPKELG